MIIDPAANVVLCFGDSNTFGQPAEGRGRWPADIRWTGQLQQLLGTGYAIIEEGLGGRTTDLDDPDRGDRNGRNYFQPCLRSHSPLDMVIIMLGNNDLKTKFGREPEDVANALERYLDTIENTAWTRESETPATLLVSPIHLDPTKPQFATSSSEYDAESARKSLQLSLSIQGLADKRKVLFADAATVASPGDDGIHLSRDSHGPLANLIAQMVAR